MIDFDNFASRFGLCSLSISHLVLAVGGKTGWGVVVYRGTAGNRGFQVYNEQNKKCVESLEFHSFFHTHTHTHGVISYHLYTCTRLILSSRIIYALYIVAYSL